VPNEGAALCLATAQLERGRRRFEVGRTLAAQRGLKDAPQLAPAWLWPCLFPSPHATSVLQHAETYGVEPALIYAVMRQESGFLVDAVSTAGARGLMQLIDPTARRIAAELGRPYDARQLAIAHRNIEYGTFYLSKLQSHFVHPALVAAAYNAGPDAAARWYAAGRNLPLEAFIARIPYDETRSYVQRVLENLVAYETLLDSDLVREIALEFAPIPSNGAPLESAMHRPPPGFY
jgi:soluble lytic murein transglycosylase